jgi:DNA-3-methyladenine glycosylase
MISEPRDGVRYERDFFLTDAVTLARRLLGAVLAHDSPEGLTAGVVVETEAYAGRTDAACHAYGRDAPTGRHRTDVMFAPGGRAYVYLIYGMYNCFNVTANAEGEPEAVLIRALEPTEGTRLMASRRGTGDARRLCSGPGKLCMAMGITLEHYGADLTGEKIFLLKGADIPDEAVAATPRINVDYAGADGRLPYRFAARGSKFLSTRKFIPAIWRGSRSADERFCRTPRAASRFTFAQLIR